MSVTKPALKHRTPGIRPSADKPDVKDRRAQLLAAAADVFVAKGFHDAKVSDIVAAAGVAQGTFYLYFKTKADVLQQLIGGCCRDIVTRLEAGSAAKTSVTTPEELRMHNVNFLIGVFVSLENEHQAAKLILGATAGADEAVDKSLHAFKQTLVKIVKEDLKKGISGGYIRKLNPDVIAEATVGMIYHVAFERFVLGHRQGVSIRQLAEELVSFELDGIAAKSGGA